MKARTRPVDTELYTIDGEVVVDEIIRQEALEEDLARIARRLELRLPAVFPASEGEVRLDRRPAHEILTGEQKAIVRERFRTTFELLGYEP